LRARGSIGGEGIEKKTKTTFQKVGPGGGGDTELKNNSQVVVVLAGGVPGIQRREGIERAESKTEINLW
jgi:hypothetical protein